MPYMTILIKKVKVTRTVNNQHIYGQVRVCDRILNEYIGKEIKLTLCKGDYE